MPFDIPQGDHMQDQRYEVPEGFTLDDWVKHEMKQPYIVYIWVANIQRPWCRLCGKFGECTTHYKGQDHLRHVIGKSDMYLNPGLWKEPKTGKRPKKLVRSFEAGRAMWQRPTDQNPAVQEPPAEEAPGAAEEAPGAAEEDPRQGLELGAAELPEQHKEPTHVAVQAAAYTGTTQPSFPPSHSLGDDRGLSAGGAKPCAADAVQAQVLEHQIRIM